MTTKFGKNLLTALFSVICASTAAHAKTEITLQRFFGACEADYGQVVDATKARGECGIITALVNEFNATNTQGIVVKPQIAEWGPYYDQLTARIVAKDLPTIAVMHESVLGDFVSRKLVEPLDAGFKSVGIDTADFTEHAAKGTVIGGKTYALPFDTWSWLWHINVNLFKKAGLTDANGAPVLPTSADELLAQAKKFQDATGKPYFAWTSANETAAPFRTFVTLVAQQGGQLFSDDGRKINMHSKEAMNALELMDKLNKMGAIKPNLDYSATQQAFVNGDVGVDVVGTWTIDDFIAAADKADSPLHGGYTVVPFANIYGKKAAFADGHSWIMLKGGAKTEAERKAAFTFLKFLWDNNFEWSRTGHLTVRKSIASSEKFTTLPFRKNIAEITSTGFSVPNSVPRQRAIETIVGEEISNMILSGKPAGETAISAEARVNKLLSSVK
jgi:multiple sugar transport system substrate-binding protein